MYLRCANFTIRCVSIKKCNIRTYTTKDLSDVEENSDKKKVVNCTGNVIRTT